MLKAWTEISADTLINGFVKAGITEKTTTIEIAAEDESVSEDIDKWYRDSLWRVDGIGFSSELLDN